MTAAARGAGSPHDVARVRALESLGVSGSEPEERFDRITRLAQQLFDVPMASVTLIDDHTQWLKSRQGVELTSTPRHRSLCDHAIRQDGPAVVEDLLLDPRFVDHPAVTGDPGVRFYAGHPLTAPGGYHVGTLCLADVRPRSFGGTELALLREFAAWAEAELLRSAELDRAAEIQRNLIPRRRFLLRDYDFGVLCTPSRAVGGDFVDWYRQPDDTLVLTLGDVMGKGMGAAIMMATVRAALRTAGRTARPSAAVQEAALTLDDDLQESSTLVTLLHGHLVPPTGELTWTDVGHGLLLLVRADGTVERSRGDGLPLGTLAGESWTEQRTVLHPGDTVVAFSDGVLDLYDGTLDALDEVVSVVRSAAGAAGVVGHFTAMARARDLPDDVTVMVLRRLARPVERPAPGR